MLVFFLQMWTNWGLSFESILSSTDQKNPADFNPWLHRNMHRHF